MHECMGVYAHFAYPHVEMVSVGRLLFWLDEKKRKYVPLKLETTLDVVQTSISTFSVQAGPGI